MVGEIVGLCMHIEGVQFLFGLVWFGFFPEKKGMDLNLTQIGPSYKKEMVGKC